MNDNLVPLPRKTWLNSDRLTSGAVLSMTNQDIGERPAIQKLPFSFLICKYIDLPSLTLPQMCWSGAEQFQDNLALVDAVNGDSFTFSEARSLARSFESGLVRMGGQAADVVAIVLPNMPQYALAFLGAAEAGFVITTLNPTYTK